MPRFWCGCRVCVSARGPGSSQRRTRSAALLRGPGPDGQLQTLLLDCGPDLHGQLARQSGAESREGRAGSWPGRAGGAPIVPTAALISHAHNDHLLGLGDLLDYRAYAGGTLPIFAPPPVIPQIEARFGYAFSGSGFHRAAPIRPLPADGLDCCGFRARAVEVPHGANGSSFAFRLDSPTFTWAYLTDAIGVPERLAADWFSHLDLLVLGAALFDESAADQRGRSVYDVQEALRLPWARSCGRVLLTHLSHEVDTDRPLPDPRYSYARDGLTVPLTSAAGCTGGP